MKITVIIPVYNSEAYLPACLDSILSQTYSDLEIILVDDGSRDSSPVICDAYVDKDSRIRVIHQENSGVSAARNAGLDAATGDWVGFVDADDTIEPNMYETLLNLALEKGADIAHCGYKKIRLDGTTSDIGGTGILLVQNSVEASKCLLAGQYFVGSPWNKLYKRDLFTDIRFDPKLKTNEDVYVNVLAFQKASKLVFWDLPLYHYYERVISSWSRNNHIRAKTDCATVAQGILTIYQNTPLEQICIRRYFYALLDLYRTCLLEVPKDTELRNHIHLRIKKLKKSHSMGLDRQVWNYWFMRYFPRLYILTYHVYQQLFHPGNDL